MAETFTPLTTGPGCECRMNQKATQRMVKRIARRTSRRLRAENVDCCFTAKGLRADRVVRANSKTVTNRSQEHTKVEAVWRLKSGAIGVRSLDSGIGPQSSK